MYATLQLLLLFLFLGLVEVSEGTVEFFEGDPGVFVLLNHLLEQLLDLGGDLGIFDDLWADLGSVWELELLLRDVLYYFLLVLPMERLLAVQHLVQNDAHRPDITLFCVVGRDVSGHIQHIWGHVLDAAHLRLRPQLVLARFALTIDVSEYLDKAEVGNLD